MLFILKMSHICVAYDKKRKMNDKTIYIVFLVNLKILNPVKKYKKTIDKILLFW